MLIIIANAKIILLYLLFQQYTKYISITRPFFTVANKVITASEQT